MSKRRKSLKDEVMQEVKEARAAFDKRVERRVLAALRREEKKRRKK